MKLSHRYDPPEAGESPPVPGTLLFLNHRVRLYRDGVCEWGRRYRPEFIIPTSTFAEDVHDALLYFSTVYEWVAYYGPVRVWVSLDRVTGVSLGVPANLAPPLHEGLAAGTDRLEYSSDSTVESLLTDPLLLTGDAMDFVWQAYGWPRCLLFGPDGELRVS